VHAGKPYQHVTLRTTVSSKHVHARFMALASSELARARLFLGC
jgi:hypothetical protein